MQQASVATLRDVALPHLRRLVEAVGETANVMVLAGPDVRFVATVESNQVLRVGDRTGRTLPAHLVSGGKAVLATLDGAQLAAFLAPLGEVASARLEPELRAVRRRGLAVNDQETEAGLTAVGVTVPCGRVQRRRAFGGGAHGAILRGPAAGLGDPPDQSGSGDRARPDRCLIPAGRPVTRRRGRAYRDGNGSRVLTTTLHRAPDWTQARGARNTHHLWRRPAWCEDLEDGDRVTLQKTLRKPI